MIDKQFCMSSYLTFRYIEHPDMDFYEGLHHRNIILPSDEEQISVLNSRDIDRSIAAVFESLQGKKLGLLLSGGMDSACLASYMPGMDAYTFRFLGGTYQQEELNRAEYYAKQYGMNLHYVDISWENILPCIEPVVRAKHAPVHSIEPQLYLAAKQAQRDGVEHLIIGESADLLFGGMNQLLAKDWSLEEFQNRYTFTNPADVLVEPVDMSYLYERYRSVNGIDFLAFMDDVFSVESSSSYWNAFTAANVPYTDPYAKLRMAELLDLQRVRNGDSKYLIRDLFRMKYPGYPVPEKVPMPRLVDQYFADWAGPSRPEFRKDMDITGFTGNQKWQMWCLEFFLNLYEPLGEQ